MMKKSTSLLFFIILCLTYTVSVRAAQREITLAYLEQGLSELNENEKQIALQLLANELIKDSGLYMTIKPISTFPEIKRLILAGKIDYVIFNSYHYISHHDFIDQNINTPIWTIQRGPSDKENHIIVANKRHSSLDIKQFKDKTASLHQQYLLMKFYFEYIIKKTSGLNSSTFFKSINNTKTASKALLDVYFGLSDLCIVPKYIYDLSIDLNPALSQKLSIIHQSGERFLPILIFSFKHVDPVSKEVINNNIAKIGDTIRGRQILDMFNIQSVKLTNQEQIKPMINLYTNYQALIKQ